ncbi:hypothetical protein SUGI_1087540 [Cryptomeria japonica]|nr:hypothetical protein SUGI_1087540 [Cryptomeria japonica]
MGVLSAAVTKSSIQDREDMLVNKRVKMSSDCLDCSGETPKSHSDVCLKNYNRFYGICLPAESSDEDDTGYDECIIPTDITNDDFHEFIQEVPSDCIFIIVSDSCHSGNP